MSGSPTKRRSLPPVEYLQTLLRYSKGKLYWRERPASHFKTKRSHKTWNASFAGTRAGSEISTGYRVVSVDGVKLLEHRIIYHMTVAPVPLSAVVDHIDHDKTNNSRSNLRLCTQAQNGMNQPPRRAEGSPPKHVYWSKSEKKFKVQIRANGRVHFLGTFETVEEASRIAADAGRKLHGDYQYVGHGR